MLNEYYKRKLSGGRTRLARAIDYIVFRALLLIVLYLWFSSKLEDAALEWFLSAISLSLICVAVEFYKSIRLDKFKLRENERIRQEYIRSHILLLPGELYVSMVHDFARSHKAAYEGDCLILPLQKSEPLNRDSILSIYRLAQRRQCSTVALFSPAEIAEEAQPLIRRNDILIIPQTDAVFTAMAKDAGIFPEDTEIEGFILERLQEEKAMRKKSADPFASGRIKRYLIVGLVLFAASFFVSYALYYRMMASVCISLASLAWWLERSSPPQKL